MRSLLVVVAVVGFAALAQDASGQEAVQVTVNQQLTFNASGERIAFIADGGCMCQTESRIAPPATPCNGALCTASRLRADLAVATAVNVALDGGALTP